MRKNIILMTDSYKLSHHKQYPENTTNIYSYFESRIGAKYNETVFFGLQYFLKEYFDGVVVTKEKLEQAKKLADTHVGPGIFNYDGWKYITEKHNGKLPLRIKAVPEGTPVTVSNVLMTVEVTDPKCYWLTNYVETLLVQVWYPSVVASLSRHNKKTILKYLEETGDPNGIMFKLHDFGYRGVSSNESASLGGAAHLVNFMGTDTIAGITMLEDYYAADQMPGFSIPASEHSTITSWTRAGEVDAMRNMLTQYPKGLVACVSDSWDIINACRNLWGGDLRDLVLARDGVLVVRPDSGDPVKLLPEVLSTLGDRFGTYVNSKGFRVLNDKVRVIQGDGITPESIPVILEELKRCGWSADNLAFGSGGGLLQKVDRDTNRFAFKCSEAIVGGIPREVFKQPITDGTKNSKKGRLKLIRVDGKFVTVNENEPGDDILETVFENGEIVKTYTLSEVRDNAAIKESVLA
jgi:nicotinamide phosphoribosyltransferase